MRPLNVPRDDDLDVMLRRIGQQVLEDVWIGRRAAVVMLLVAAVLSGAAVTGWRSDVHTIWMSRVAIAMFLLTAALSAVALGRKRFRWCCAAAYTGGLSTAAGLGMIWWHQTAPAALSPGPSAWMPIGVLCAATLTAAWLRLILTPLERSQPDIRRMSVQEAV